MESTLVLALATSPIETFREREMLPVLDAKQGIVGCVGNTYAFLGKVQLFCNLFLRAG